MALFHLFGSSEKQGESLENQPLLSDQHHKDEYSTQFEVTASRWLSLHLSGFAIVLIILTATNRAHVDQIGAAGHSLRSSSIEALDSTPSDANATGLTRLLYTGLLTMSESNSVLFGHQYSNVYGQHFNHPLQYSDQRNHPMEFSKSDVANSTGGDYPVVFGYNLQDVIDGKNLTKYVDWAVARGGIITYYWQTHNPITGGLSHDCSTNGSMERSVASEILTEGTTAHETFMGWLDNISDFFLSLTFHGEAVPIIFRPFHECTADWYWWGTACSEDNDFLELWLLTQDYLVNTRGVHNILWEYAPSKPADQYDMSFNYRWPGDNHVDIVGFDRYSRPESYRNDTLRDCMAITNFAKEHGKIAALSETGILTGINTITEVEHFDFFTEDLLQPMMQQCPSISFALTFSNFNTGKYWVPLPGQPTYESFISFYNNEQTYFLKDPRWRKMEYVTQIEDIVGNVLI